MNDFTLQDQLTNVQNAIAELENAIHTNPELADALALALDALAAKQDELMALAPEYYGTCSVCGRTGDKMARYVTPDNAPCCDPCSMRLSRYYEDSCDDEY
jgi:hypothetical protein